MALFKIKGSAVTKIVAKELDLEKNLQALFEQNLEEILNIIFLAREYSTSFGGRIDSLGIDKNGSPCIIEYKKNQNDNVINQGLSYLRWLLDHKADFEKLVEQHFTSTYNSPTTTYNGNIVGKIKIDWDSPRVICIAESYSKFDLDTADILPIDIELMRYRIYDEDILYLEPENYQKVKISTSGILKKTKQNKEQIGRLQKTYSIEDHLAGIDKQTVELFQALREKILSIDEDIVEEAKAKYIAYKLSTNFTDIEIWNKKLKVYLNIKSGQLKDPHGLAHDLTKPKPIGHWGNGDYRIELENINKLEEVFALIKQSYDLSK
jgi:predicted transport protein